MKTLILLWFLAVSVVPACLGQGIVYYDPPDISVNAIIVSQSDADIDIDRDGLTDFSLRYFSSEFSVIPKVHGAVWAFPNNLPDLNRNAVALSSVSVIPPVSEAGERWDSGSVSALGGRFGPTLGSISSRNGGRVVGPFAGIEAFLGFRLQQPDGEHYGWMRVDMIRGYGGQVVNVSDWAYNTVPGQSIAAGAVPEPGTLALLALGIAALWKLRRRA